METLEDPEDTSEGYQLRVRISAQEKEALERLVALRSNTNISKLVREALALLLETKSPSPGQQRVWDLANLLKREPLQVESACIEGIFDMIENKASIPLIVMEAKLYQSYTSLEKPKSPQIRKGD